MPKRPPKQQSPGSAPESQTEPKQPNPKIKLVYVGPCMTSEKKLGGSFLPITEKQLRERRLPETLPPERIYGGRVSKLVGRPGTIYEFECSPENGRGIPARRLERNQARICS